MARYECVHFTIIKIIAVIMIIIIYFIRQTKLSVFARMLNVN